jgi:ElaB/YqjD/DUF883 family membrane-anchored ribosome-binding protein
MNTQSEPQTNPLPEAVNDVTRQTSEAVKDTARTLAGTIEHMVGDVTDAAKHATETAKDMCQSVAMKAEDTLKTSKHYVRQNPVPVILGAVALGAALGCLLMMVRRQPTFSEKCADTPMAAVRDAILGALSPVSQRVQDSYDSARDVAGTAVDRMQSFTHGQRRLPLSHRIGNALKFW